MKTAFDAVVVGAGPAGSTVARELAERGLSTALLDREQFPRDKPCGGGITARTAALLPFSIAPVTEQVVSAVEFSYRMRKTARYTSPQPLVYMTQRCRFDALLVEKAVEAGVQFRDRSPVRSVETDRERVTVRTGNDVLVAGLVVGADGANGITGRAAGLKRPAMAVAYEGNAPYTDGLAEAWSDALGLDLGWLPGGYGWIFPKGDHVNIGVGGWRRAVGPHVRTHLSALSRYYRLREADLFGLRGHHLPMRRRGARIASGRTLLIGDAAGLVDPLSGEGIYGAIRSAQIAAPHIESFLAGGARALSGYEREIDRLIMPELEASRMVQYIYHSMPGLYTRLFHSNRYFWHIFCAVIRGETTFDRTLDRLGPFAGLVRQWARLSQRRLTGLVDT